MQGVCNFNPLGLKLHEAGWTGSEAASAFPSLSAGVSPRGKYSGISDLSRKDKREVTSD